MRIGTDLKPGLAIALFHFEKRSNATLAAFTRNPDSSFWELLDPDLYPNYDVDPLNTGQEHVCPLKPTATVITLISEDEMGGSSSGISVLVGSSFRGKTI